MSEQTDKLRLLDDLPAAIDGDKFHHSMYSNTLRDVLLSNRPGISVGLFGQWGYGKSTTVDQLEESLHDKATVVVFNAWKTRGDSLRKQLLLAILEKVDPAEAARYKEVLGIPDVKKALARQEKASTGGFLAGLLDAIRECWKDPTHKRVLQTVSVLVSILIIIMALLSWKLPTVYQVLESTILALAVSAVGISMALLWKKYLTVIGVPEATSESQLLQYPEHFRDAFERQIKRHCCEQKHRLVIVIDDLDRCEASAVVEALSAIRQFADQEMLLGKEAAQKPGPGCQFLVPCDERQVVLALEADGHYTKRNGDRYHNYETELLRKFFDVVIRMDQFLPDCLAAYAKSEAASIGLADAAAGEFIDLVNPINPREVKKLLNSYKLALVTLARRQEARLLPASADMPELERTLMVLTALRESSPRAYDDICKRPSLLHEYRDDEKKEQCPETLKDVSGIIERSGRISQITAEYLIYGQYEPELMGCENGGALALAFKRHNHDRFKELLGTSKADDRKVLQLWLLNKISCVSTVSRLRGDISMFVDYGHQGEIERDFVVPCIEKACNVHPGLIREVLDDFPRFDELRFVMDGVDNTTQKTILDEVLANFLQDPEKRNRELSFLLSSAQLLDEPAKKNFSRWLEKSAAETKDAEQDAFVQRVFGAAQPYKEQCNGLAPSVGIILAQKQMWTDDIDEAAKDQFDRWSRSQLVTILIGKDSAAAWKAITSIFNPQGQLATPIQIHVAPHGVKPAWRTAKELTKIINNDMASELFSYVKEWLSLQVETGAARIVLDTILPILPYLEPAELEEFSGYLAKFVWDKPENFEFLADYVGKKPRGKSKAESWTILSTKVFQHFSGQLRAINVLNDPQRLLLEKISALGWNVDTATDKLLESKIQQLPPNGNTQQIEVWADCFTPLLRTERQHSSAAIRNLLKNRQSIFRAIRVALVVLWEDGIKSEDATSIGNICVEKSNVLPKHEDVLSRVMVLTGSERVIEVCVEKLKDNSTWLQAQATLLEFVAKYSSVAAKDIQQKYQSKLKRLLVSDDVSAVLAGLTALNKCEAIEGSVKKEVTLKESSDNEQIAELAKSILAKAALN